MINCPVDGRQNITSDVCPQCKSDLRPLIYIKEMPEELFQKGSEFMEQKNFDKALEEFFNAHAVEPGNTKYMLAIGQAFLQKGYHGDASEWAKMVLETEPDNQEAIRLTELCSEKQKVEDDLKARQASQFKKYRIYLFIVPVLTLILGISGQLVISTINVKKPDQNSIVRSVLFKADSSLTRLELRVKVTSNNGKYILSGEVPTKIHSLLAEETLMKILAQYELTKIEVVNSIMINPERLLFHYTVQYGDNLTGISKYFLGSALKWEQLLEFNKGLGPRPDHLKVGEQLLIPIELK